MDTDINPDQISKPPKKDAVKESPSRAQYNKWLERINGIEKRYPSVILKKISPDELNGLTLEEIDTLWEQISRNLDKETLELYEPLKHYLTLPRVIHVFPNTLAGDKQRNNFKKQLEMNPEDYKAFLENDLPKNTIGQVLLAAELIAELRGDDDLSNKSDAIYKRVSGDKIVLYTKTPIESKEAIANDTRALARSIIFPQS